MALGRYKHIVLTNFAGGLNTRFSSNLIADNESPDLQNVVFNDKGAIQPRQGIAQFGSALSSIISACSGSVHSALKFSRSDGVEIPMVWNQDKWFYYNNYTSDWALLNDGYTPGAKFGGDSYASGNIDEYIYVGNAVQPMYRWNGRYGMMLSGLSPTSTVAYLNTLSSLSSWGWATSGSAIIGTEAFTYASCVGNSLSCITRSSAATAHLIGDAIAQFPLSSGFTNVPRGNIYKMHQNRLHIAGVSGSLQSDYYSKLQNPLNFSFSSPISAADGGIAYFPEGGGPIRGFAVNQETLVVFKKNNIKGLSFTSDDLPALNVIVDGMNVGANNDNIDMVENGIFYINPIGEVKQLSRPTTQNPMEVASMSEMIRPTLQQLAIDNSVGKYYDYKFHAAMATSGSTFNNTMLLYDYSYKAWSKFIGLNAAQFFTYGTDFYYGAANEPRVYQTYVNYDDNGYGYESYWTSKNIDYGYPHELKRLRHIYVEGYMTENCPLSASLYFNGDTTNGQEKVLNGNASYIQTASTESLIGKATFGKGTYGGTANGTNFKLSKFQIRLSYSNVDFFTMQFKVRSNTPGAAWKITHIAPYIEPLPSKKFPEAWVL